MAGAMHPIGSLPRVAAQLVTGSMSQLLKRSASQAARERTSGGLYICSFRMLQIRPPHQLSPSSICASENLVVSQEAV